MNGKKIFGIGAVVLMILVTAAPTLSGLNIEQNEIKPLSSEINAKITRCEFIEYTLNRAKYEIDWIVYFDDPYGGEAGGECKLKVGDVVFDTWNYHIPYMQGYDSGTRTIYLKSSEIPALDEERKFAGKIATMEVYNYDGGLITTPQKFAKHWKEDDDYVPTEPQVEVSAPHWFDKVYSVSEIPDLYYLDFFNVRNLPNILFSDRLGWVSELCDYLYNMSKTVAAILGTTVGFLLIVKDDIKIVVNWIEEVIIWFSKLINGQLTGQLLQLIEDLYYIVRPAVARISAEAAIWGGLIAIYANNLVNKIDDLYEWMLGDPWSNPIKIKGRIDKVKPGETVIIECRDVTEFIEDKNKMGVIFFEIYVTGDPLGNEKYPWSIHDCTVTVTGSRGELKSTKLLSYAFSNGSLYWNFKFDDGGSRNVPTILNSISEKICGWLRNKPIFNSVYNLLKERISSKKSIQPKPSEIEFDLDSAVQKAIVQEKQYESNFGYLINYEEYYPDAPKIPHTTYYVSDQVIVGYESSVDPPEVGEEIMVGGWSHPIIDKNDALNAVIVLVNMLTVPEFIEKVQEEIEGVEYAEENLIVEHQWNPNDPYYTNGAQWGPQKINCPKAWDVERGDITNTRVAIIDTGIDDTHPDIYHMTSDVDYDFVNDNEDPTDDHGHGTHCAGILSACTNNEKGIAGVAAGFGPPGVYVYDLKVLDKYGRGDIFDVASAIIRAAQSETNVISMSLGAYGVSILLNVACKYARTVGGPVLGCLIVAAAGNDGNQNHNCIPARYDSVISVGAIDENNNRPSWSNWGSDMLGGVDLVAPGVNIISTTRGSYEAWSGTSMATPHVAGVAALFFSQNPHATANACENKLKSTATPMNSICKYGLVNAYEMVKSRDRDVSQIPRFVQKAREIFEII